MSDGWEDVPSPRVAAMAVGSPKLPAQWEDVQQNGSDDQLWNRYIRSAVLPVINPLAAGRMAIDVLKSPPAAPGSDLTWGQVPKTALQNLPKSALQYARNVVQPFIDPVGTGKAVIGLADALGSKISRPGNLLRVGDPEPTAEELKARAAREAPADALGRFYVERYGGIPQIKQTVATDPVGTAADLSSVLSLAGGALRLAGVPGQLAPMVSKAGAMVDPLTQAGNAVKLAGKGVSGAASQILGMTTGAGADAVRMAANAGRAGGDVGQTFRTNMRGAPVMDVVDKARDLLSMVRNERGAAYRADKARLATDASVIPFDDISRAVDKASDVAEYRGRSGTGPAMTVEPAAAGVVETMRGIIDKWKVLDPAEFHTPEGIDALKRALGNIRDSTAYRSPERVAADRIYNTVRSEIVAKAPFYAKMMEDYDKSSKFINEASKTFSLGEKATGDTAARKLLSATRNNVQTNYGERQRLLDVLAEKDPTLPAAIAGQALNSPVPRGLVARLGSMVTAPAAAVAAASNPATWAALPALAAFSPRAVGEVAHAGGRAFGGVESLADLMRLTAPNVRTAGQAAFQAGRLDDVPFMLAPGIAVRAR